MKAAILVEQNNPLIVSEIDSPELTVGQVLVKVLYSGVCGKQVEEINGKRGHDPYLPHLLGHEASGIVSEVGPGVRKVKEGDLVVLHWMKGSGIDSDPPRFLWNGNIVSAGWITTFSDYTIVSENRVTKISQTIDPKIAALFGCAVTTGLGIVFNNINLKPAQSIAVFGVGGVGINVLQGASLINAYPIIAVDVHDSKLEQAKEFGATHAVNSAKTNVNEFIDDISQGSGVDATVDLTGISEVRETAYNCTKNSGKTIFAGVPSYQSHINLDSFPLHFGRQIIGSHGGDTVPDVDINRYAQLYALGKLKLSEQITHTFKLDNINDAIAAVKSGEAGRCIVAMD